MAKTKDSKRLAHALYMRKWTKANPEKVRANRRNDYVRNRVRHAYNNHKGRAKHRGIPFLMTFEEWWAIWSESGKWEQRGSRRGQYVMARHEDRGAYAVGNVRICTSTENNAEQASHMTEATRKLMSDNAKRQQQADPSMKERLQAFVASTKGKPRSEEVRRKISAAQIGKLIGAETRAKLAEAARAQWARKKGQHS